MAAHDVTTRPDRQQLKKALLWAVVLDAVLVLLGVAIYFQTGDWLWIVFGAALGAGIVLPVAITAVRQMRGER